MWDPVPYLPTRFVMRIITFLHLLCTVWIWTYCTDWTKRPSVYHVTFLSLLTPPTPLPQEIQDRIRIIELYAKDRQFADFVRQHQT